MVESLNDADLWVFMNPDFSGERRLGLPGLAVVFRRNERTRSRTLPRLAGVRSGFFCMLVA